MTSLTLSLTGDSSELRANYFPPIVLDQNAEYVCGLTDFQTFNSIPNVNASNNKLHFWLKDSFKISSGLYRARTFYRLILERNYANIYIDEGEYEKIIKIKFEKLQSIVRSGRYYNDNKDIDPLLNFIDFTEEGSFIDKEKYFLVPNDTDLQYECRKGVEIATGSYELDDIITSLNLALSAVKSDDITYSIQVHVNKNTLTTELKSNALLDFRPKRSIGPIFGFKSKQLLEPNILHKSDGVVKISAVNALKIECNITAGAYSNNSIVHTIHEFYPSVPVGYKIIEVPRNIIYLPVTERSIDNLTVRIVDQDNKLVNFRGEMISLRLHIKRI
jgi:hypothetical protein